MTAPGSAAPMTQDEIREWLFTNYLRRTPEAEAEVTCILAQDDWKYLDVTQEKYRGMVESPGDPQQISEADGFAITALYECHDGPHLATCPRYRP